MSRRGSIWREDERLWPVASLADDSISRALGLLGRKHLPPEHALWLLPCRSVHMFGMRFALDLLWLDRAGRVLALQPNLRPWRFSWPRQRGVHSVIEVAAGEIARHGISIGQQLHWRETGD